MCLAVPSQVRGIEGRKAVVELGGVTRVVDMTLLPEATVGDYVLVHTGYAITLVDEAEAQETLKLLEQLAECHEVSR